MWGLHSLQSATEPSYSEEDEGNPLDQQDPDSEYYDDPTIKGITDDLAASGWAEYGNRAPTGNPVRINT